MNKKYIVHLTKEEIQSLIDCIEFTDNEGQASEGDIATRGTLNNLLKEIEDE